MVNRAFYPGRFQPFHNGHLQAVKYILSKTDEVVIGVMAAQFNFMKDNPFSAGERVEMIKLALREYWDKTYVIPIENVPNNLEWVPHVLTLIPSINVVFTNNPLVKMLFQYYNIKVKDIPWFNEKYFSGRYIRKLIASNGDWEKLVPREVAEYIKRINGVERIKELFKSEEVVLPIR